MIPQPPAQGISQMSEHCYRIDCDCTDDSHAIMAYIDVVPESDYRHIEVRLYSQNHITDTWPNRIRQAWGLLTRSSYIHQHEMILSKQAALNFSAALVKSIEDLDATP
jgi:hypothetical protein